MKNLSKLCIFSVFTLLLFSCDQRVTQIPSENKKINIMSGSFSYQAPKEWIKEGTSNSMRKAQYRLKGVKGQEDAILSVFFFPSMKDKIEMNLNRWKSQFKMDAKKNISLKSKKSINSLAITNIYIDGDLDLSQLPGPSKKKGFKKNYALLGVVVETDQGPWFFKTLGPKETVVHWMDSFEQFKKTFILK